MSMNPQNIKNKMNYLDGGGPAGHAWYSGGISKEGK